MVLLLSMLMDTSLGISMVGFIVPMVQLLSMLMELSFGISMVKG